MTFNHAQELLREGRESQREALGFLRANAEKTKSVLDRLRF